jgi:hypothetical protein
MLKVSPRPIQRLVVRGSGKVVVHSKPRVDRITVVQTVSPVPTGSGEVADPGDLTLIFNNKLI